METQCMEENIAAYAAALAAEELSARTIEKYVHNIRAFMLFCEGAPRIEKADVILYKNALQQQRSQATVNSHLIALNRYLAWLNARDLCVKTTKTQRAASLENVISAEDYQKILAHCQATAHRRDYLLIRTMAATGIRVSELAFVTAQAVRRGYTSVRSKGRVRSIYFPAGLAAELLDFCAGAEAGEDIIFHGSNPARQLHPSCVWKIIKKHARAVGVCETTAYPHSLRHLFAKTYMQKVGNIFELADLLGHASTETTRIYARTSGTEKLSAIDRLGL